MGTDVDDLKAQIAALTAAIQGFVAGRTGPARADMLVDELGRWYFRRATKQAKYTLGPFLRDFGGLRVSELTKALYIGWRDERSDEETIRGAKRSVGTLNLELATANALFRAAVTAELIAKNPLDGIADLKGQRARETEINPADHARAIATAPPLVRVFQSAIIETGMRFNEARLMEWSHVEWDRARIHIPRENTKGKLAARNVPLTNHLRAEFKEWPRGVSRFVFASSQKPGPYSRSHLTSLCRPYLDRLSPAPGDGRVVTHDGRHSAVSRLARGGLNPLTSMKIIGHRTASMHWRYLHVSDEDREKAKRILDGDR